MRDTKLYALRKTTCKSNLSGIPLWKESNLPATARRCALTEENCKLRANKRFCRRHILWCVAVIPLCLALLNDTRVICKPFNHFRNHDTSSFTCSISSEPSVGPSLLLNSWECVVYYFHSIVFIMDCNIFLSILILSPHKLLTQFARYWKLPLFALWFFSNPPRSRAQKDAYILCYRASDSIKSAINHSRSVENLEG